MGLAHRKKEVVWVTGMLGAKEKMVRRKTGEAEGAPCGAMGKHLGIVFSEMSIIGVLNGGLKCPCAPTRA